MTDVTNEEVEAETRRLHPALFEPADHPVRRIDIEIVREARRREVRAALEAARGAGRG